LKFLNLILNIFKNYSIKLNIILTSHSTFILSDLPKENIIFLEKGKQVYPFEDGKQTFGANIHTLLSHGFFMKEGLMGEFAKSKIDDVIKYLNNDIKSTITTDNSAQNIINIIGEPIIKRELQRMLKNKMELSNKTEIDTIKEEIEFLKHRLEILRKG
jgi:polyhydroxyalkanoate synthesis regulator phasin